MFTILFILLTSTLVAIVNYFIKSNAPLKVVLNFVLFAIPYFIICFAFGKYGEGNKAIIVIFVYFLSFAIITTIYYTVKHIINKIKQDDNQYEKQFK